MKNEKCFFVRETYDVQTNQRDRFVYSGALLSKIGSEYDFAFKFEEGISRIHLHRQKDALIFTQQYASTTSKLVLNLKSKGQYQLNLLNGKTLIFISETSFIKVDDFRLDFKYNLYDEYAKEILSIIEISIIGENKIC